MTAQGEEDAEDLIDGESQAVDVVLMPVKLGLRKEG